MKITIDTKEDSHHEIQKAITLLQSLISGRVRNSNIFEEDTPSLPATNSEPSSGGLFNMFGGDTGGSGQGPVPEPPAVDELRNLNTPEVSSETSSAPEEKKETPELMEY